MKKLVMMMAMAAAGAAFGDYAYLYWEVDQGLDEGCWREFDYAQLRVTDRNGNVLQGVGALGNYDASGGGPITDIYPEEPGRAATLPIFGDISDYASSPYGFVVEAYLNGDLLWTSGAKWYEDLVAGNHIWSGVPSAMSGDLAVATYTVPEPTSGLLLLLGFAGLALRRKRA